MAPFSIDEDNTGLTEVEGLLHSEESGFWGTSLTFQLNSLEIASEIPHAKGSRVKLKVKRRDREKGQTLQVFPEEKLGVGGKELPGDSRPRPFYECGSSDRP